MLDNVIFYQRHRLNAIFNLQCVSTWRISVVFSHSHSLFNWFFSPFHFKEHLIRWLEWTLKKNTLYSDHNKPPKKKTYRVFINQNQDMFSACSVSYNMPKSIHVSTLYLALYREQNKKNSTSIGGYNVQAFVGSFITRRCVVFDEGMCNLPNQNIRVIEWRYTNRK